MTYHDKLLDPRWQRRRLQILLRDDFTCQECLDNKKTVHVHHKVYKFGLDPWDYPDEDLITLCEDCHSNSYMEVFYEMASEILSQPYTKILSLELDRLVEKYNV